MKKILTTPIKDEDLADLNIGDVVYLSGRLVTCRDVAHRRLIEQSVNSRSTSKAVPSFMLARSSAKNADDNFEMVSIGPTTSMRMEKFEREFISRPVSS